MKTIGKIAATAALAGTLAACGAQDQVYFNFPEANGYDVQIRKAEDNSSTVMRIGKYRDEDGSNGGLSPVVFAHDYNGDGRFDEVRIQAPKGDPIEELADLDKLSEIERAILQATSE